MCTMFSNNALLGGGGGGGRLELALGLNNERSKDQKIKGTTTKPLMANLDIIEQLTSNPMDFPLI